MKRFTAVLICLTMLFSLCPAVYAGAVDELIYIPVTLPFSESSALTDSDGLSFFNTYAKGYSFYAEAGLDVTITLASDDFDAYLHLLYGDEITLARDDDGGGGSDAKIVYKLPYTGIYYVEATQFSYESPGNTGSFTISISVAEAEDTIIQYATLMNNPNLLHYLETGGDPHSLAPELDQTAAAVFGIVWRGQYIEVPIEWRYSDFDSEASGIRIIIGDISLPAGFVYESGELTVESPVLVYDPDGDPVEIVFNSWQGFNFYGMNIIPLGMAATDVEARLSSLGIRDAILIEIAGGYTLWADVSVDASKVDASEVGDYYPVTIHMPPGVAFSPEGFPRSETAVYVIDPEEVDLRAVGLYWSGVVASWIKEITDPELWISIDGGEWQNVLDGGDWLDGVDAEFFNEAAFLGRPPYTTLDIYAIHLKQGHIYDFEVRYENGGFSVNRIRIDLNGDHPVYGLVDGDRTGGDRYKNPWDIITGGIDGDESGSNQPPADSGGDKQNDPQRTDGNNTDTEPSGMPDMTETGPNGHEPDGVPQTPATDAGNNEPQNAAQTGNLILEPSNPVMTADTGTESVGGVLPYVSTLGSGLSIGSDDFSFDFDGSDDPMELRFDFLEPWMPVVPQIPLPIILTEPLIEQMETARPFPIFPFFMSIIGIGGISLWLIAFLRRRKVLTGG
jgi:hypothetical protein